MQNEYSHYWIVGPYQKDREETLAQLLRGREEVSYTVDCHQRLRGPYSGTGALLRKIVPEIESVDLLDAHTTEILSIAPELNTKIKASFATLTTLAIPEERTRFYSRLRTLRLAHGLIEFLHAWIEQAEQVHCTLVFEHVHAADALDQEFLTVLLRRARPLKLSVVVCSTDALPLTLASALEKYARRVDAVEMTTDERRKLCASWKMADEWRWWMLRRSVGWRGAWEPLQGIATLPIDLAAQEMSLEQVISLLIERCSEEQRLALAQSYVASECLSEDPLEQMAYDLLSLVEQQDLHDGRAEALEAKEEWSLHLGAIPYHRERGKDPRGLGVTALRQGANYCLDMGYYEATLNFGKRGRSLVNWETQLEDYWLFTTRMTTSLGVLEHPEEAEVLYKEILALTSNPMVHMHASYAMAMLYTRHYKEEQRDHQQAKRWIQTSVALASLLPASKESAFHLVFCQNGMALVELHVGQPYEALRLVSEGLAHLDRVLELDEHRLHRSVLLYNRAQVYAGVGELEQALADYTEVIKQDPYYNITLIEAISIAVSHGMRRRWRIMSRL